MTVADIERVIKGNYRVNIRLGLLDPASGVSYTNVGAVDPCTTKAHKDVARFVTQKSIVLLKNNGLLPLNRSKIKNLAVLGALRRRRAGRAPPGTWCSLRQGVGNGEGDEGVRGVQDEATRVGEVGCAQLRNPGHADH